MFSCMCRKIRCDGESWKVFGFLGELNKQFPKKKLFIHHIESLDTYMEHYM